MEIGFSTFMNITKDLRSTRFFPHWKINCGKQVTGFIQLMQHIYKLNSSNNKVYVELGSNLGESALMAGSFDFISEIYCVDLFDRKDQLSICQQRLSHLRKKVTFLQNYSNKAHVFFDDNSIDVLYIDANHTYEYVKDDLEYWYPKVKDGGFICGHDYNHKNFPGVTKAVHEFVELNTVKLNKNFCDRSFLIINTKDFA